MRLEKSTVLVLWAVAGFDVTGTVAMAYVSRLNPEPDVHLGSDPTSLALYVLVVAPIALGLMWVAIKVSLAVNGEPSVPGRGYRRRAAIIGLFSPAALLIDLHGAVVLTNCIRLAVVLLVAVLMLTRRPDGSWLIPVGRQASEEEAVG